MLHMCKSFLGFDLPRMALNAWDYRLTNSAAF